MTKKITFENLPAAVERILDILNSESSEHADLPELVQRINMLEKKIDYLQKTVSPDRPLMDMHQVCRVLKLRPKAVSDLAFSGALPSMRNGRRTLFFEDGVVRYFMNMPAWKEAVMDEKPTTRRGRPARVKPEPGEELAGEAMADAAVESDVPQPAATEATSSQILDVNAASVLLERSSAAVRQLLPKIPHHRDGRKIYFLVNELKEWAKHNRPRKKANK